MMSLDLKSLTTEGCNSVSHPMSGTQSQNAVNNCWMTNWWKELVNHLSTEERYNLKLDKRDDQWQQTKYMLGVGTNARNVQKNWMYHTNRWIAEDRWGRVKIRFKILRTCHRHKWEIERRKRWWTLRHVKLGSPK